MALAGLSAGSRGANTMVYLIVVGGAASWIGMLWTALRPGLAPNVWQKVMAGLSWLMPITMLVLREEFTTNFILLSIASAICVSMIVVVYPSQTYTPPLAADRRLEAHMAGAVKAATEPESTTDGSPGVGGGVAALPVSLQAAVASAWDDAPFAASGQPASVPVESAPSPAAPGPPTLADSTDPIAQALELNDSLRAALLKEGVSAEVIESATRRMLGVAAFGVEAPSVSDPSALYVNLAEGEPAEGEPADPNEPEQDPPLPSPAAAPFVSLLSDEPSSFTPAERLALEPAAAEPTAPAPAAPGMAAPESAAATEPTAPEPAAPVPVEAPIEPVLPTEPTEPTEPAELPPDEERLEGITVYQPGSGNPAQTAAPSPEPVEVVRTRSRDADAASRWDLAQSKRKGTVGGGPKEGA